MLAIRTYFIKTLHKKYKIVLYYVSILYNINYMLMKLTSMLFKVYALVS